MDITFDEFKNHLKSAFNDGSLLVPKHDPYQVGQLIFNKPRTVLSHDLADNLESFLNSGSYSVEQFENTQQPQSPLYFVITPDPNSGFSVPASGVTAYSVVATTVVDKLIAVSGSSSGWHLFGESSAQIQANQNNGNLLFKKSL